MNVLITGVNGFVGRYLENYLKCISGLTIYGTSRKKEKYNNIYYMDICKKEDIQTVLLHSKPDYIFHLAAQSSVADSWANPQFTMDVNYNGTLNILDCVKELKMNTRVLLVGSCEEYGGVDYSKLPIDEKQPLQPTNPYAVSKAAQNMAARLYVNSYGIDIVTVRSFNQIGVGQNPKFVISYFAKKIAEIEYGLVENILPVGNLNTIRDFIDVRDAVRAYWLVMRQGLTGEVYNIGSGHGRSINEMLQKLLSFSDMKIKVVQSEDRMRPTDVPVSICNNAKIKDAMHWEPSIELGSSLSMILDYWRSIVKEEGKIK